MSYIHIDLDEEGFPAIDIGWEPGDDLEALQLGQVLAALVDGSLVENLREAVLAAGERMSDSRTALQVMRAANDQQLENTVIIPPEEVFNNPINE